MNVKHQAVLVSFFAWFAQVS